MSLADFYNEMTDVDAELEKIAAQEIFEELGDDGSNDETMKLASEYDAAGRIMARAYFDEFQKMAAEAAAEDDEEEEDDDEKKEEGEDKDKKKDGKKKMPPALAAAFAEKKASLVAAMQNDPEYAQAMYDRYMVGE